MRRVVLVHGAGGGPEVWVAVARKLRGVDTEAVALPGHRDGGAGCDGIPAYAAWLAERLEGPAVVGGASMGGAIALQLALDRPELVEGLVLASTAARLRVDPAIVASLEGDYAAAAHALAARELAVGTHPGTVDKSAALILQVPQAVTVADFRACDGFDVRGRLGEVEAPALVVVGEDDVLTPPAAAQKLAAGLAPRVEIAVIPGAGHLPMVEQPRRVAAAIQSFLDAL
jgi:pimeloyl-ACP methyl ester carboxylesterase